MALVSGFNGSLSTQSSDPQTEELANATRYLVEGQVDLATNEPALVDGKAYVATVTAGGFTENYIYVANNGSWTEVVPTQGTEIYDRSTSSEFVIGNTGALEAGGGSGGSTTVVDNLTSTSATAALSANQGRQLKSEIDGLSVGDFLADGSVPMTGSLNAGGNTLTNLAAGSNPADAVTKQQLDDGLSALGTVQADVADITARNALTDAEIGINDLVFVTDASADSTVDTGWAIYKFLGTGTSGAYVDADFRKIQEQEGLDVAIKTTVPDWTASTIYAVGQLVQEGHRTLKATTDHTSSAATFRITDAPNWVVQSQNEIRDWAPSTVIVQGEMVHYLGNIYVCSGSSFTTAATFAIGNLSLEVDSRNLRDWTADTRYEIGTFVKRDKTILRRAFQLVGGGASGSSFDETEAVLWELIQQSGYSSWAQNQVYVAGEKIAVNGEVYSRDSGGSDAGAQFYLHAADWTLDNAATDYDGYTDRLLTGLKNAAVGTGYRYRATDYQEQSQGYRYAFTDEDGATSAVHEIETDNKTLGVGEAYQYQLTVAGPVLANQVLEVGYSDNGGNSTTKLVNIGINNVGVVAGGTDAGNVSSTISVAEVNRGGSTSDIEINLILTFSGPSGGDQVVTLKPAYNTDGTNTADIAATGSVTVLRFKAGATSDFPSASDVSATLIDSSVSVTTETLPAATGSGAILFYTNRSITEEATLSPQSGQAINGATDRPFYFSNYSANTSFKAVDFSPGDWSVGVVGSPGSKTKPFARLELTLNGINANSWGDGAGQLETYVAATTAGQITAVPFTSASRVEGGMVASPVTSTTYNPTGIADIDVTTYTDSNIVVPDTGMYRIRYKFPNVTDASIDQAADAPVPGVVINGSLADSVEDLSQNDAEYDPIYGVLDVELQAGDRIQLGMWSHGAGETFEFGDLHALPAGATSDVVMGYLEVEKASQTETVLAGMVEPTTLATGRMRQTVPQTYNDAGFNIEYDIEFDAAEEVSGVTADLANNQFVINRDGRYDISGVLKTDDGNNNADYYAKVSVNGTVVAQSSFWETNGSSENSLSTSIRINLNAGDTVKLLIQAIGTTSSRLTVPEGGLSVYLEINQCPTSTIVNPDAVPVEDLRTLLGSANGLTSNSNVTISQAWGSLESEYEGVEFEFVTTAGTLNIRQTQRIDTAGWTDGTRTVLNADDTTIVLRDMDIAGVTANLFLSGTVTAGDVRVYGIKAQKTVQSIKATDAEFFPPTDYTPALHAVTTDPAPDGTTVILGTYSGVVGPDSGDRGMLDINIQYRQTVAGAAGSGTYFFGLPSGFAIDPAYIEAVSADPENMRSWGTLSHVTDDTSDTHQNGEIHLIENAGATISGLAMSAHDDTAGSVGRVYITDAFYDINVAVMEYKLQAKVPVVRL